MSNTTSWRPTRACSPTPLCGRKIRAFLKPGFGSLAFSIYRCGAADAQSVGRTFQLIIKNSAAVFVSVVS
jgi:hypothetical protein